MYPLPHGMFLVLLLTVVSPAWAGQGIEIKPDETGRFEYVDDFNTPRLFADAASVTVAPQSWQPGAVTHAGPRRTRKIVWRFYGDGHIRDATIEVPQQANDRNLGGVNHLYLSANGLDWMKVASSSDQSADSNGWQKAPFIIDGEATKPFLKANELWVKVVMSNRSGLKTATSSLVNSLKVSLSLDKERPHSALATNSVAALWQSAGHKALILDSTNTGEMPPLYHEEADGWLSPWKVAATDAQKPFEILREGGLYNAPKLSAVAFIETRRMDKPLGVRIEVRSSRSSTRKMTVHWDGKLLDTFDTASFFDKTAAFDVLVPGPHAAGAHELRIGTDDLNKLQIQRINVTGDESLAFADKPRLPETQPLQLLSAYYMPDHKPPADSQVAEGRQKVSAGIMYSSLQQMHAQHAEFGALRIDVKNPGQTSVRITGLTLNDRPVQAHNVDFLTSDWDARGVVWHRIHPQTLAAGQCAEVYVRFRKRPEGTAAKIVIETENAGALTRLIPFVDPDISIDYVTTDRSHQTLTAYIKPHSENSTPTTITSVTFDGETLVNATILDKKMTSGTALITALLPKKLNVGDYHIFGVRTASGDHRTAEFRVLPFEFPRSSIHVPVKLCGEMHMNLLMWNHRPREECEMYDVDTTTTSIFNLHDRETYILGPDEPDAHDNVGSGYDRGLGLSARRLALSRHLAMIERFAPGRPWWVIMNGTTRPLNWCVYGQMANIACFDPYPVNFYGADHANVRESLLYARRSGAPRRLFACLEAFGWRAGQGVPRGTRGPTPEEYRQNVVQAIGSGMKGLTSWVYSSGASGWQLDDACRKEISRMNALIEAIESDLLIATPVDWARSDAGKVKTGVVGNERWEKDRVWVGASIAGPDTIVLAAVNHIPASKPDPPVITPAENVTVTVDLPPYLTNVTATEVTDTGEKAYLCETRNGKAILKLDLLEAGRVFVLRRTSSDAND